MQSQAILKIGNTLIAVSISLKQTSRILSRKLHTLNMRRRAHLPINNPRLLVLTRLDTNFPLRVAHLQRAVEGELNFALRARDGPSQGLANELAWAVVVDAGDGAAVEDTLDEHVVWGSLGEGWVNNLASLCVDEFHDGILLGECRLDSSKVAQHVEEAVKDCCIVSVFTCTSS